MNCPRCDTELIWGGDHDVEDSDEWAIESNASCQNCGVFVLVLYPFDDGTEKTENSNVLTFVKKGAL